jgi:hypothetical protein
MRPQDTSAKSCPSLHEPSAVEHRVRSATVNPLMRKGIVYPQVGVVRPLRVCDDLHRRVEGVPHERPRA